MIRAKAAIYAAGSALLGKVELKFQEIETFYLAGGFGRFLDIEDSRKIGRRPSLPRQRFRYVGNSSMMGAYLALVNRERRKRQEEIARYWRVRYGGSGPVGETGCACFVPG